MRKQILISILLAILLVIPIASREEFQIYQKGDWYSFDPRIDVWYQVEDWELEVCRKWGGTTDSYNIVSGPTYLSQTTVTLQGEKSEKMPDDTTLYEVAWYIEDATNRSLEYAVRLRNSETVETKRIVGKTSVGGNEAASGYEAEYLSEEYDQVQLGYAFEDAEEITMITVPVIDNKGEYVPSSDYGSSDSGDLDWGDW